MREFANQSHKKSWHTFNQYTSYNELIFWWIIKIHICSPQHKYEAWSTRHVQENIVMIEYVVG